jgi:hypothetical protein
MFRYVTRLYDRSPRQLIAALSRRLRANDGKFDTAEVLSSSKHMQSQRPYNFLNRYETIISRVLGDGYRLEFEGKRVLEIGCGPLLGWAPLAIFLGARDYLCVEPMFNPDILRESVVRERYLSPLHKDLMALYGPRMPFDEFAHRVVEGVNVECRELADADIDEPVDIVLSNSVLEHIFPFDVTIDKLRGISAPGSRFLHLVDFGNHRATRNPFDEIYGVEPGDYRARIDNSINLLRAPDMVRSFEASGFAVHLVPYYDAAENHDGQICAYWRDRYSDDELFLKAGILTGSVPA